LIVAGFYSDKHRNRKSAESAHDNTPLFAIMFKVMANATPRLGCSDAGKKVHCAVRKLQ
jgi:hypothetical protein